MRFFFTNKSFKVDPDAIVKALLLFLLTVSYALLTFTIIIAVAVLPFGTPIEALVPPPWLWPITERFFLLDAFLSILFGPAFGISLIALLVVILTTPRAARWLRVGINDLIYGQHDDAFALISQVNPHISGMNLPHTILPTIAATIAQTLKLPYVELEAQSSDAPLINTVGTLPKGASIERIPLLYQKIKIGELRVAARHSDEALSQSDLTVLRDLARQVGIALYAAHLTDDLQRARIRLVTAREEERRRIRRDLHDGLGPTLANFAMQLEQAREQLPPGAVTSERILASLTTQAQDTIADVRRLVYDLRPPDLDEYGLLSALHEYSYRRQTKQISIRLVEPPTALPTLPAAVEVAAYRIVQEAVNNALKHAQASAITITVTIARLEQQRGLHVEIADNGMGLPADHPIGIGLHSMRERAEELGGSFTMLDNESASAEAGTTASGTKIITYLPLEYQEDEL